VALTTHTLLTAVGGLKVGGEVAGTRSGGEQVVVWDAHTAASSARALGVQDTLDVDIAAEMTIVTCHAPAD